MSFEVSGLPAFLIFIFIALFLIYLLVYLPIKAITYLLAQASLKTEYIRRLKADTIITEYEPPNGLSAAEIGYLFDNKLNESEIFAMIINLQQKSLLNLEEKPNEYLIKDAKLSAELNKLDTYLLKELSKQKGHALDKKMIKKLKFGEAQSILLKQLRDEGYLLSLKQGLIKSGLRLCAIMFGLYMIFPILTLRPNTNESVYHAIMFFIFSWPFYLVISALIYAKFTSIAGEPWVATKKLSEIWPDIEGYRQYIKMVELDNLKFDSQHTKEVVKNKSLPYAIALGFNTGWRDKIK